MGTGTVIICRIDESNFNIFDLKECWELIIRAGHGFRQKLKEKVEKDMTWNYVADKFIRLFIVNYTHEMKKMHLCIMRSQLFHELDVFQEGNDYNHIKD